MVAIGTLVIAPLAVFMGEKLFTEATEPQPAPQLRLNEMTVTNDGDRSPVIDLKLTNTGERVSYITRVAFRVRHSDVIDADFRHGCYGGAGYTAPSAHYDVSLPNEAGRGTTVDASVSQTVKADEVDRFDFRLGVPADKDRRLLLTIGPSRLFQIDVLVYHDGKTNPLNAGTALIAVPFPRDVFFDLPRQWGAPGSCELANRRRLTAFLRLKGIRDAALVEFSRAASAGELFDDA